LHYSKDHEWVKVEGEIGTVGINRSRAESLGDVVYVELQRLAKVSKLMRHSVPLKSVKAGSESSCQCPALWWKVNDSLQDEPEKG